MAYKFNPFTGNFDDFNGPNGEFTSIDVDGDITIGGTGRVSFPLGLAATPSLYPDTDTNTGIYSPGADQLAVATNGTGRLFVSSTGTVGIDTNETGFNGQGLPLIVGNGSGNLGLTIYSGNNDFGTVQFADAATTGADSYRGVVAYKHGDEYMYFSTNATEKLRIDSSGRLLVGTGSDSGGALFQVNGDRIRVGTAKTPATSGATGTTGEIAWDADYIYVCTATNTWKRSAIATW